MWTPYCTFRSPPTSSSSNVFLVNFYRQFLPGIAGVEQTPTDAFQAVQAARSTHISRAFSAAKHAVAATVSLAHPKTNAVLSLAVDASDMHIRAIIQQLQS
jgi:hypothetical protein